MGRRLRRGLAWLAGASILAYVAERVVEDRRYRRRLARPVTTWPEVPVDPAG